MVPVFKNVGERSTAKNYRPVILLSVVSKVLEKLNEKIIGLLITWRNVAFFLISSMVLGLLNQLQIFSVISDRTARVFNRFGATQAVALDISKAFDRVWNAGLLHKLKSCGILGQIFGLIFSFLSLMASSGSGWKVFSRISS